MDILTLQWRERLYYRDQLRAGRYAALADAEGFQAICFALEALGMRLHGKKGALGQYEPKLAALAQESIVLSRLTQTHPALFTSFAALADLVRTARNDAMHTGVYARHATAAAIELCIGLEEALMTHQQEPRQTAQDFMVKSPISVERWQPVAHARQLMLTHSFSFLPVLMPDGWKLISEGAMAQFLRKGKKDQVHALALPIEDAMQTGLRVMPAELIALDADVDELLERPRDPADPRLWLVHDDQGRLCGVLSPFELM
jgi:CBS domain-containing protein